MSDPEVNQILLGMMALINVITLIMTARMQTHIAELKLYVHENFMPRRRIKIP